MVSCGGMFTVAIKNDGTMWAWGNNLYGKLGDGTSNDSHSPIQIGYDKNWKYVFCGGGHTIALKNDCTLWAWGENSYGQLGIGTKSASFIPTQIGSKSNWSYLASGYYHSSALQSIYFKTFIPLSQGWNLISSNITPALPDSMQYIWAYNTDKLVITKNNAGSVYIPQFGINSIGKWDVTQGYQVYMSAPDTLGITGEPVVPAETGISLKSGWNMIAYLRSSEMEEPLAFASITDNGNLVLAKNLAGQVYIPSFGINSIGNLVPGQGYRVYVTNNDTLVYPDN